MSDGQEPELRRIELVCDATDYGIIAGYLEKQSTESHRISDGESNFAAWAIAEALMNLNAWRMK